MAVIEESEVLQRTTRRGTPLARSWTDDWAARVEAREDELDRRICGARTIGGTPCPQAADHASGRCGHHGGAELTGAPDGNRNAAVHMLYSRRLMTCGEHCPMWNRCPLGGGAANHGRELLKLREVDRPTCPFEQSMYNAVVTDAERRTRNHHENAWGLHVAHTVALMTVVFSRAAASLGMRTFIDKTESYGNDQLILTERFSPQSVAFEKLGRELRRWTMLVERSYQWLSCDNETAQRHEHRQRTDVNADPDSLWTAATGREFITDAEAEDAARQKQEKAERDKYAFRKLCYTKLRERFGDKVTIPPEYQDAPSDAEAPSDAAAPTTPLQSDVPPPLSFPRRRESTVELETSASSTNGASVAGVETSIARSDDSGEGDSRLCGSTGAARGNDKGGGNCEEDGSDERRGNDEGRGNGSHTSPRPEPPGESAMDFVLHTMPDIFGLLRAKDPPSCTMRGAFWPPPNVSTADAREAET